MIEYQSMSPQSENSNYFGDFLKIFKREDGNYLLHADKNIPAVSVRLKYSNDEGILWKCGDAGVWTLSDFIDALTVHSTGNFISMYDVHHFWVVPEWAIRSSDLSSIEWE